MQFSKEFDQLQLILSHAHTFGHHYSLPVFRTELKPKGQFNLPVHPFCHYCFKVQTAKVALRRLKTLRHPNILRFIDALEVMVNNNSSHFYNLHRLKLE